MLTVIILFLGAMILTAAIIAMGAVPEIFRNAEKIDEAKIILNNTQALLQQDEDRKERVDMTLNRIEMLFDHQEQLEQYIIKKDDILSKFMNETTDFHKQILKEIGTLNNNSIT